MSQRWQASATYTLSWFKDAQNQPFSGLAIVPFTVAPDLGNEFTLADTDQRHRAVLSGIWEVGKGFQVSGLHYLGAGIRSVTNYGGDVRSVGAGGSAPPATRMAPSSRATTTSSRRRTRPTCACSSGFRSAAAWRSTSSARRSTCSTRRT